MRMRPSLSYLEAAQNVIPFRLPLHCARGAYILSDYLRFTLTGDGRQLNNVPLIWRKNCIHQMQNGVSLRGLVLRRS